MRVVFIEGFIAVRADIMCRAPSADVTVSPKIIGSCLRREHPKATFGDIGASGSMKGGSGVRSGAGPVVAQCAPTFSSINVITEVVSLTPFPVAELDMDCKVARLKVPVGT